MEHVVGIGEMKVVTSRSDSIITHALGSCIGVTIWDPTAGVGGLLHLMLPDSRMHLDKALQRPAMFADTGVPLLFRTAYGMGAEKSRMVVYLAGGAAGLAKSMQSDIFQIGGRNIEIVEKLLRRNGVTPEGADLGGSISRTMRLDLRTGDVQITSKGVVRDLSGVSP